VAEGVGYRREHVLTVSFELYRETSDAEALSLWQRCPAHRELGGPSDGSKVLLR
jgi:hypothetical protein